jgi:formylglycine-generating enzyme required for sulfatase activity
MRKPGASFVGWLTALVIASSTAEDGAASAAQGTQAARVQVVAAAPPAPAPEPEPELEPAEASPSSVETAGAKTCDPNAMPLPNRNLVEEPGLGGCPPGMARIDSFCVDRFEASLAVVNADGSLEAWSPYYRPREQRVRALSLRNAVPQGYVTGNDAAAACAEAGKRLCSDKEWVRACKGPSGTKYPYGPARVAGACNESRRIHPAVDYFDTKDEWVWSALGHQCINQLPESLDRTASNTECVTPEGVFDMMGNLHEWTANPAGTFRGGYYVDTRINGQGCDYVTTWHPRNHWDYSTGFRCCSDP